MPKTEREIEELLSDRKKFDEFIYTPLEEALSEIKNRKDDKNLIQYVNKILPNGVPLIMKDQKSAVLFRQVASPNYELRRFLSLVDGADGLTPLFFEYHNDKFTDNNDLKYYLGMMPFYNGKGKKGGEKINYLKIIDFQSSRGKPIKDVKTRWGQSLSAFHKGLFKEAFGSKITDTMFFDASEWFNGNGNKAKTYYKKFLTLFLKDGVLFENFMINEPERSFTKEVFLPAFIEIYKETKTKPLIVALAPTEIESNIFWFCLPGDSYSQIQSRLKAL